MTQYAEDKIPRLQESLRSLQSHGWVTFGTIERTSGVYRGWCRNFVSGSPSRMSTPKGEAETVETTVRKVVEDMKAIGKQL